MLHYKEAGPRDIYVQVREMIIELNSGRCNLTKGTQYWSLFLFFVPINGLGSQVANTCVHFATSKFCRTA